MLHNPRIGSQLFGSARSRALLRLRSRQRRVMIRGGDARARLITPHFTLRRRQLLQPLLRPPTLTIFYPKYSCRGWLAVTEEPRGCEIVHWGLS